METGNKTAGRPVNIQHKDKYYKKKYEEAIERLKQWDREHPDGAYSIQERDEFIFPELAESEDEKSRKWLVGLLRKMQFHHCDDEMEMGNKALAWLENRGEQNPKFRIGDTIKKKSTGDIVTICEVDLKNREYRLSNTGFIPFKYEYLWELVEQKPTEWSEEDEKMRNFVINIFKDSQRHGVSETIMPEQFNKIFDWLESLRPQSQWKPSDEQMELIKDIVFKDRQKITIKELAIFHSIYNDLKKLREK